MLALALMLCTMGVLVGCGKSDEDAVMSTAEVEALMHEEGYEILEDEGLFPNTKSVSAMDKDSNWIEYYIFETEEDARVGYTDYLGYLANNFTTTNISETKDKGKEEKALDVEKKGKVDHYIVSRIRKTLVIGVAYPETKDALEKTITKLGY